MHADTDRGHAVQARGGGVVLAAEFDARHVFEAHGRAVGVGAQHDVLELLDAVELAVHRDRGRDRLAGDVRQVAERARRHLGVLRTDRGIHVVGRQVEALQLRRVDPDAHRVLGAEQLGLAHAVDPLQFRHDVARGVVTERHRVEVGVVRGQHREQQEVVARLVHAHALLRHGRGQTRRGAREPVLHVHLREVFVGAGLEADGDGAGAVGLGHRFHVDQAGRAVHLALDHGQHAVLECLRGGTGVGDVDHDGRWGHRRVLRDRQLRDGDAAHHDDEQCDHPREDRSVDKEFGHARRS
ncbi:hypothetical protein D9M68_654970 [compost metagenome]